MNNPQNVFDLNSKTLSLCEYTDGDHVGFWLYDKTRRMNLSIRAKTAEDAFVDALHYYQRRLTKIERQHKELESKVEAFVSQFASEDDDVYVSLR